MAEQTKMSEFSEKLAEKLSHFVRVERIIQKLNSPSMSVMSETFPKLLDEIDESSVFLEQHVRSFINKKKSTVNVQNQNNAKILTIAGSVFGHSGCSVRLVLKS